MSSGFNALPATHNHPIYIGSYESETGLPANDNKSTIMGKGPKTSKAARPSKARKPYTTSKSKPFTPIKRFFFKLEHLAKQNPLPESLFSNGPNTDGAAATSSKESLKRFAHRGGKENAPAPHTQPRTKLSAHLALQNEDQAIDAIVITALDAAPFCCHEDLLTMPRDRLVQVAASLNDKLPAALRIDVSHDRPSSVIRSAIELIVGLRGDVPQAPKAVRSRPALDTIALAKDGAGFGGDRNADVDEHSELSSSPPTSPLAARSKYMRFRPSLDSPRMEKLEEVDEDLLAIRRTSGRKVERPNRTGTSVGEEISDGDDVEMLDGDHETRPTPPSRIRNLQRGDAAKNREVKERVGRKANPRPLLRSRSHAVIRNGRVVDMSFVNVTRGRYRVRSQAKTSDDLRGKARIAPKKRLRQAKAKAKQTRFPVSAQEHPRIATDEDENPFLDDVALTFSTSEGRNGRSNPPSPMNVDGPYSPSFQALSLRRRKESREPDGAVDESKKMETSGSASDMDICN